MRGDWNKRCSESSFEPWLLVKRLRSPDGRQLRIKFGCAICRRASKSGALLNVHHGNGLAKKWADIEITRKVKLSHLLRHQYCSVHTKALHKYTYILVSLVSALGSRPSCLSNFIKSLGHFEISWGVGVGGGAAKRINNLLAVIPCQNPVWRLYSAQRRRPRMCLSSAKCWSRRGQGALAAWKDAAAASSSGSCGASAKRSTSEIEISSVGFHV